MLRLFGTQKKPAVSKVIAVLLYADWCEVSKKMVLKFHNLRQRFGDREVLFLELNITDGNGRHQAELLSSALGISETLEAYEGKTGMILTMTARGRKVFGRMQKPEGLNDLFALVEKQLRF